MKWVIPDQPNSELAKKKCKYGARDVLTQKVVMNMKCLESAMDYGVVRSIDEQIISLFRKFYMKSNMGYVSNDQEA